MNRVPSSHRPGCPSRPPCFRRLRPAGPPVGVGKRRSSGGGSRCVHAAPLPRRRLPSSADPAAHPALRPAVLNAANNLLGRPNFPLRKAVRFPVVIDPDRWHDWRSSPATQAMGARIVALIKKYPQYEVLPLHGGQRRQVALVLVGNLHRSEQGAQDRGPAGSLPHLPGARRSQVGQAGGQGIGSSPSRAPVDVTPTAFFQDSPAWTEDPSTLGYIRGLPGDQGPATRSIPCTSIASWRRPMVAQAIDAYTPVRTPMPWPSTRAYLRSALRQPVPGVLGLYLTNWRLGRKEAASTPSVRWSISASRTKRVGVKFLFRPGTTAFIADRKLSRAHPIWLAQLASRAARRNTCLEVTGHQPQRSGADERTPLVPARGIRQDPVDRSSPGLGKRTIAHGVGSREALIGNSKDDGSDALDRRVEFKVIGC